MKKHQVFIVWFIVLLVWSFYRANFFLPEWLDELIIKPIIFVLPVVIVVLKREKKNLATLGMPQNGSLFVRDLYIGVVIGVLFAFEGLLANYVKYGHFSFGPILALKASGGVIPFFFINLATAVWEEILGRGYIFQRLLSASSNQWGAALTSSFLFLLLHIPIMFTMLHLTGYSLLVYPVSIMILGITNCYILKWRGNLTLPVLIHAFWNMTVALYL
ncbi:CPBP family intramembrane metalloprotease [Patescibacteria group bacterium]|nr:CPBP family intramembrane metalloprotease [Patescibacteria group bacterium]MCL5797780.1 CPBP family intramembrane metalloprotease [Patescibacteria group bacterium]